MGGGAWKVAYADFVTAMMAFFLLMWILNMTTDDTKAGLAKFFTEGATGMTNISSPVGAQTDNPLMSAVGKLTTKDIELRNIQRSYISILRSIEQEVLQNTSTSTSAGMNTDGKGVTLRLTPDLMFAPNSTELSKGGYALLDNIVNVINKYNTYLIIRGHADRSETGAPKYNSAWDLSAARANMAVSYVVSKGVNPKHVRSIAYADTQPDVPQTIPDAARRNGRVEFVFHRPEVLSDIGSF